MSFDARTGDHRAVQRLHAIARCQARYRIRLSVGQYLWMCDEVWASKYGSGSACVESVPGYPNRFFVLIQSRYTLVAWSELTMQIATFLPVASELVDRPVPVSTLDQAQGRDRGTPAPAPARP